MSVVLKSAHLFRITSVLNYFRIEFAINTCHVLLCRNKFCVKNFFLPHSYVICYILLREMLEMSAVTCEKKKKIILKKLIFGKAWNFFKWNRCVTIEFEPKQKTTNSDARAVLTPPLSSPCPAEYQNAVKIVDRFEKMR